MRYSIITALAALGLAFAAPAAAEEDAAPEGLAIKTSAHSVAETMNRLSAALDEKGIRVLGRVDHASNAAGAGATLPPTELILFGNPALGTPLMQSARTAGIDLPMKVLVYDDEGTTRLVYNDPAYIARRHGIADRDDVIEKMSAALDALTSAAVK